MRFIRFYFSRFSVQMIAALFVFLAVLSGDTLHAHITGQSYIFLKIYDTKVTGRFEITLNDLNKVLALKAPAGLIAEDNLQERIGEVQDYYLNKVSFFDGKLNLPVRFTGSQVLITEAAKYAQLKFTLIENAAVPDVIEVDYMVLFDAEPSHEGLLIIEQFWKANIFNNESSASLFFSKEDHRQRLKVAEYSLFQGFLGVVKMGMKHIWDGIDHILFLVALILPAAMLRRGNSWQPVTEFRPAFFYVVKIVTLFTIAHSVTLSLAALRIIELPSALVESIIALSIAVAAMDILFPVFHSKIGWVVFAFGLFHGFGFASVLTRLGVLGEHMALSLFGFNLGVEIGQVVIISLIFPVLYLIRQYSFFPKIVMRYGAAVLILVAMVWFIERAFGMALL